ncbi:MAG: rhamnogalacturonan acetylesterase, partial [Planctomycetia bacterium]|nr:rhamnogalacturonan acetylesterase [Planctomycetia bacterium]
MRPARRRVRSVILLAMALSCTLSVSTAPARGRVESGRRFDLGPGRVAPGFIPVSTGTAYSSKLGYGFDLDSHVKAVDRGGSDPLRDGFCTADRPFFFSADLPEGNYNVTVTLGDRDGESVTTVKAESRRLMLERVRTRPGEFATRTFTVNTRDARGLNLKPREKGVLHWDDKLTLEFSDTRPCVCAIEITPAGDDVTTVYLVGDSTVTDQPREPFNSWGQMLPRFFKPGVADANHAESGESLRSFQGSKRLDKVLGTVRKGDYLFIQFGHNDQKDRSPGAGASTTYTASLKHFVAEARRLGAVPVLVTPVSRRTFDAGGKVTNSLGGYPDAVRKVAAEEGVTLIDLNAMSVPFYEALGPEGSKKAFTDNTHHNNYGSYELARCVIEGIRRSRLGLAKSLADDVTPFDPAHPDPV